MHHRYRAAAGAVSRPQACALFQHPADAREDAQASWLGSSEPWTRPKKTQKLANKRHRPKTNSTTRGQKVLEAKNNDNLIQLNLQYPTTHHNIRATERQIVKSTRHLSGKPHEVTAKTKTCNCGPEKYHRYIIARRDTALGPSSEVIR
jgi:hypothetical protein